MATRGRASASKSKTSSKNVPPKKKQTQRPPASKQKSSKTTQSTRRSTKARAFEYQDENINDNFDSRDYDSQEELLEDLNDRNDNDIFDNDNNDENQDEQQQEAQSRMNERFESRTTQYDRSNRIPQSSTRRNRNSRTNQNNSRFNQNDNDDDDVDDVEQYEDNDERDMRHKSTSSRPSTTTTNSSSRRSVPFKPNSNTFDTTSNKSRDRNGTAFNTSNPSSFARTRNFQSTTGNDDDNDDESLEETYPVTRSIRLALAQSSNKSQHADTLKTKSPQEVYQYKLLIGLLLSNYSAAFAFNIDPSGDPETTELSGYLWDNYNLPANVRLDDRFLVPSSSVYHYATCFALLRLLGVDPNFGRQQRGDLQRFDPVDYDTWYDMLSAAYASVTGMMQGRQWTESDQFHLPYWRSQTSIPYKRDPFNNHGAARSAIIGLMFTEPSDISSLINTALVCGRISAPNFIGQMGALTTALFTMLAFHQIDPIFWGDILLDQVVPLVQPLINFKNEYASDLQEFVSRWEKLLYDRKIRHVLLHSRKEEFEPRSKPSMYTHQNTPNTSLPTHYRHQEPQYDFASSSSSSLRQTQTNIDPSLQGNADVTRTTISNIHRVYSDEFLMDANVRIQYYAQFMLPGQLVLGESGLDGNLIAYDILLAAGNSLGNLMQYWYGLGDSAAVIASLSSMWFGLYFSDLVSFEDLQQWRTTEMGGDVVVEIASQIADVSWARAMAKQQGILQKMPLLKRVDDNMRMSSFLNPIDKNDRRSPATADSTSSSSLSSKSTLQGFKSLPRDQFGRLLNEYQLYIFQAQQKLLAGSLLKQLQPFIPSKALFPSQTCVELPLDFYNERNMVFAYDEAHHIGTVLIMEPLQSSKVDVNNRVWQNVSHELRLSSPVIQIAYPRYIRAEDLVSAVEYLQKNTNLNPS